MPRFSVTGSHCLAKYPKGSLVVHHKHLIYDLPTPLKASQVDEFSLGGNGEFCVRLKNGTSHLLQPKSEEDTARYHAAHRHKLRALRHEAAKESLAIAGAIQTAAKRLVEAQKAIQTAATDLLATQQRLHTDAKAIAGEYYESFHTVAFVLEGEEPPLGTNPSDFDNVLRVADNMVNALLPIATAVEPPPLPCETDGSFDPYATEPSE